MTRARILKTVPIGDIRAGDKFRNFSGVWGYIAEINRRTCDTDWKRTTAPSGVRRFILKDAENCEDSNPNVIIFGDFELTIAISTIGPVYRIPEDFLETTELYSSEGIKTPLEEGAHYWVRRKFLESSDEEFLALGHVFKVAEDGRSSQISFPGDNDDCTISDGGTESFFTIAYTSVLRKINYMG